MTRHTLFKLSPLVLAPTAIGRTALAQSSELLAAEALFNVHNYGATGDGKIVDTRAINNAIQAVARSGGGTWVFPAGT